MTVTMFITQRQLMIKNMPTAGNPWRSSRRSCCTSSRWSFFLRCQLPDRRAHLLDDDELLDHGSAVLGDSKQSGSGNARVRAARASAGGEGEEEGGRGVVPDVATATRDSDLEPLRHPPKPGRTQPKRQKAKASARSPREARGRPRSPPAGGRSHPQLNLLVGLDQGAFMTDSSVHRCRPHFGRRIRMHRRGGDTVDVTFGVWMLRKARGGRRGLSRRAPRHR